MATANPHAVYLAGALALYARCEVNPFLVVDVTLEYNRETERLERAILHFIRGDTVNVAVTNDNDADVVPYLLLAAGVSSAAVPFSFDVDSAWTLLEQRRAERRAYLAANTMPLDEVEALGRSYHEYMRAQLDAQLDKWDAKARRRRYRDRWDPYFSRVKARDPPAPERIAVAFVGTVVVPKEDTPC